MKGRADAGRRSACRLPDARSRYTLTNARRMRSRLLTDARRQPVNSPAAPRRAGLRIPTRTSPPTRIAFVRAAARARPGAGRLLRSPTCTAAARRASSAKSPVAATRTRKLRVGAGLAVRPLRLQFLLPDAELRREGAVQVIPCPDRRREIGKAPACVARSALSPRRARETRVLDEEQVVLAD